jgi:hypothetical protein
MARRRISRFVISSVFIILMIFLAIVYFSEINPNAPIKNKQAEQVSVKELTENARDYVGRKVTVQGIMISPEGDYMMISDQGKEFAVRNSQLSLKTGEEYEIEGVVRSRPSLYYRYYQIEYYLEPIEMTQK